MIKYPYERKMKKMNYKGRIIELANKGNGYISTKEIVKNNIPKIYLTQLIDEKKIVRITRGLYMLPDCFEDEYYKFQMTNKNAIFSLETALYLHGFSDRIPTIYYITVPSNYGGNLLKEKNVKLFYVKNELLKMGLMELDSPMGMKIKVYDIERTICDIVKFKNKVDSEIFSKALKQYVHSKNKNMNNLIFYARQLNVEQEVRKYMEVML